MTVAMLLWSSVMTWIYSCCWSTGHGAVIYRMWDGIVLYVNATCAECGGTICSQLLLSPRIQPTHCDTVSYTVGKDNTSTLKTLKDWAFRGYSKKIWLAAFHTDILNWTRFRWREIIKFVGGRDMMAWAMELLDGCPTAPRWTAPDCRRRTLLPSPSNSPGKPTHSLFSRGECGGANTSSPAPLVTVSRLFCIVVLPFYLSEGQSSHQTILSRLCMVAQIVAAHCSCVAVPYSMSHILGGQRLLTWSPCIHWVRHRVLSFQDMARRSKTG